VNEYLSKVAEGKLGHANLGFSQINLTASPEGLSPRDALVLARHRAAKLPCYVVVTPKNSTVYAGKLNMKQAKALLDSPLRSQAAKFLCAGAPGLLVFLPAVDSPDNSRARETLKAVVEEVNRLAVDVRLLEARRDEPKEAWLVKQLLQVESDLSELKRPMLFGLYGRGRVTEAYVGAGISHDNMEELIEFMGGDCTCQIKEANLGLDLLTNWDWAAFIDPDIEPVKTVEPGGFVTFDE